ncbi:ABC transporter ATP-binding protein [Rhodocyclus tenuis]|uniref:ATP-binding cassette domain-containing protein n=2 Tax=Rhodocyclus TaxID=1064 RepID=A0A6L5JVN8_RHOTE|nr:ATP-binding cassette domain-containing protein [Rhodocyclus gracilis]NJA89285.1 ABC transporter ATP-binding protein [Rhodocyclus gracilis]
MAPKSARTCRPWCSTIRASSKHIWEAPLLEVTGLRVAYGGIQAVRGINFHVAEGEMVALIGANGAGKTSTLKALARLLDAAGGSVRFRGKEITNLVPHELVTQGIALVPEGRGVFPRMTIVENLQMGAYCRSDQAEIEADIERMFSYFPRLKERARQLAGTMSGGEQQMLAIGRALMSRPKMLLLDEPSMGLAPIMVQKIFEVIRIVASEGMTTLLVEQNAKLALETSQRGYVMESGEITLSGEASALLADPKVRAAYLGE